MNKITSLLVVLLTVMLAACQAGVPQPAQVDTVEPSAVVTPLEHTIKTQPIEMPTLEPTVEPTAVPTDAPPAPVGCLIAWAANDALVCQMEGGAKLNLFSGVTGANSPRISPSGQWIAFKIPQADKSEQLWVLNIDGSAPRLLVNPGDLPAVETGFVPSVLDYEWLAGDAGLLLTTARVPVSDEIGMYDRNVNDLYQVEMGSGTLTQLIQPGKGGNMVVSPTGQAVAISTPTAIDLYSCANAALTAISQVPFDSIMTYSEYAYKPYVFWNPDGSFFTSLVPSSDPLAAHPYGSIYKVGMDGSVNQLSTPAGNFVFGAGKYSISPDGQWLASSIHEADNSLSLQLSATNGGVSTPVKTAKSLTGLAWSLDSQVYAYAIATSDFTGTLHTFSTTGDTHDLDTDGRVVSAAWLDGSSLVYQTLDGGGWKLWFDSVGSTPSMIASGSGNVMQYDIR